MIEPISLPSAAGVNYADGDIRHISAGDAMDVPSLSNPTRQAAYRDNLLAEKVNELVADANNNEQIVALPIFRMTIPAGTEQVISNYWIQDGFEARVLSAIVTSTPASPSIQLNVYWNTGFGNTTGTNVVTTSTQYSGGTTFSPTGEFIVSIKNTGSSSFDAVASVSLSVRPTSPLPAALLPGALVIREHVAGATGGLGQTGATGAGTTGPSGLNPRGQWSILNLSGGTNTYNPNDMVWSGSPASSYRCVTSHTPSTANKPIPANVPNSLWDWVAQAGSTGNAGSDAVSVASMVYYANGTTGVDFVNGSSSGEDDYGAFGVLTPSTVYNTFPFTETTLESGASGLALLSFKRQLFFKGSMYIAVPVGQTAATWTPNLLNCAVIPNGQVATDEYFANYSGTNSSGGALPPMAETGTNHAILPTVVPDSGGFMLYVGSEYPQKLNVSISGVTVI